MIELIIESRCVGCGLCSSVCPTRVFDEEYGNVPVIARKEDCHTCYMCEAYCPVDTLYVTPYVEPSTVQEEELIQSGVLGSYRREIGWGKGQKPAASSDASYKMFSLMRKLPGHRFYFIRRKNNDIATHEQKEAIFTKISWLHFAGCHAPMRY
jgi:NAD-dependent dihydropyrimidine dehydrogenase PreA subunit